MAISLTASVATASVAAIGDAGGGIGLLIILSSSFSTSNIASIGLSIGLIGNVGPGVGSVLRISQVGRHPRILRSIESIRAHGVGSSHMSQRCAHLGTHRGTHHTVRSVLARHRGAGWVVSSILAVLAAGIGRGGVIVSRAQGRAGPIVAAGSSISDGGCVGAYETAGSFN